jgi:hypothetical protein
VEARVEEDHLDVGVDLRREVDEDRVGHGCGDAEARSELAERPLDDLGGRGMLELFADEVQVKGCGRAGHRDPRGSGAGNGLIPI